MLDTQDTDFVRFLQMLSSRLVRDIHMYRMYHRMIVTVQRVFINISYCGRRTALTLAKLMGVNLYVVDVWYCMDHYNIKKTNSILLLQI